MNSDVEKTLPDGWKIKCLEEIGQVFSGSSAPQNEKFFLNGNIPFIRTSDLSVKKRTDSLGESRDRINPQYQDELNLKIAKKGTVLFPKSGAAINGNNRAMLSIDAFIVSHLGAFYSDNPILNKFVYLFMLTIDLVDYCENPSYPSLKLSRVKDISIPIPPLEEQKRIVAKIDGLFAKINNAISLTEDSLVQAKNLLPSVLNEVFKKGIADGWEEKRLEEVAIYDKSKYKEHNRPYVGLEHIETKTSTFLGKKDPVNVKSSTFKFDTRHVLYGRLRPYLNKVLVPDFEGHCSTEIFPILPNEKLVRRYLCYWLMSPITNAKIDATWTGARMPRANMNEVIKFKLPIPSKGTQKSIIDLVDKVFQQSNQTQSKLEDQLAYLNQLKSSVLSKAFKGEL